MVISKKSKHNLRASQRKSLRITAKIMPGSTHPTKMTSIMLHILISEAIKGRRRGKESS
jgi:hypothetical protein